MSRNLQTAVHELFLALPQVAEGRSSGARVYKVAGKTFAYWVVNHHDDGRVALWLSFPPEQQSTLVQAGSKHYFIPPYLGVKGWLGLDLTAGPPWNVVIDRVQEAWQHAAPAPLRDSSLRGSAIAPPSDALRPEDINPMLSARCQEVLTGLAERCQRLPESSSENPQMTATWRVGKKVFVRGAFREERMQLLFRVGAEQQAMLQDEVRFSLPAYYHSSGWIALDVQEYCAWMEIESLLEQSYRHFAIQRQLKALAAAPPW